MYGLSACNPIVLTVYFLAMATILMFSQNPIFLLAGFTGILAYRILRGEGASSFLFYALLFACGTLLNPLISHNGKTVLFVLNDAPITWEALVFGAVSAGAIVTALLLFRSFYEIMTRDKLLYVFGMLSPKLALVLSMALRYVPLFRKRASEISDSQRALGLYREENLPDRLKADLRVFSILVTWALENGITTADSMAARGYGRGKRTFYTQFRFRPRDVAYLFMILLCFATAILGIACGAVDIQFYPVIRLTPPTPLARIAYATYGFLALLPILTESEEKIRWHCLRSKI